MKASVLVGTGVIEVRERPVPEPKPDEVLIRVAAVGVCGSDVHYYKHGRIGDFVVREPIVLGHEVSGRITGVGSTIAAGRIGERVAIEPQLPCRRCAQCKAGRYNLCPDMRFFATPPVDGAFCEYVTVPADFAHPVPDAVSDTAAALLEPLSVGVWACRKADVGTGSRVLVTGAGPIGLIAAQTARAAGATEVIVSDPVPARRTRVADFGFTAAEPAQVAEVSDVDALIECSGAPPAIASGIPAVRGGGRIVLVGMGSDQLTLPVSLIQNRELWLTGVFRYANTWPTAIALAASRSVELDRLVTGTFGLTDVEAALRADERPDAMKAVVIP
ncbi:NAD(P)-dependent alcohol dehydrogenase [Fodinicola acaciae]|uniref:NAD(P)-dependent alcohol dehydrogenase n=1 Tax=Fodinicola acaciae TaxID=2681555 RepID=UPI0013D136CB|nr:NAD(P)-dependent alcohol dehydrogenase [Fodinicola acaciae]